MGENRANPPRDGGGAVNTWPGWHCVRLLGESGFDRVYEIERTEDGHRQRAALKVITVPAEPRGPAQCLQQGPG